MASLGELERAVMERLWAAGEPVAATTLRDELADRAVALTTVHTVLTRLEQKGFVVHDDERPRRFSARASREDHAAELMHAVLGQSADRQAVLARFVGSVNADEARLLRDRGVALTTVHTVLTRLEQKGFVVHDGGRPRRFGPTASREEHAAELMHEVLGSSGDRQAVLARFVGSVDPAEARMLRELLDAAGPDA